MPCHMRSLIMTSLPMPCTHMSHAASGQPLCTSEGLTNHGHDDLNLYILAALSGNLHPFSRLFDHSQHLRLLSLLG